MSDAMAPGGSVGLPVTGTAREGVPALEGQTDALRLVRWTQAWEGRDVASAGAPAGPDSAADGRASAIGDRDVGPSSAAQPGLRSLADWRSRHARHPATRGPQRTEGLPALPTRSAGPRSAGAVDDALLSAAWPASAVQPPSADADAAAPRPSQTGPGSAEELRGLVESCCTRLLVAQGGVAAAPGVLLDLGRWMPGCSIEVARSAGVLRLTLRGAAAERRGALVEGLDGLRDDLAQALGCAVLVVVDGQGGEAAP